jgi:hypothetical protein
LYRKKSLWILHDDTSGKPDQKIRNGINEGDSVVPPGKGNDYSSGLR